MNDDTLRADEDAAWRADGERHGWHLPPKAAWPFRLWGARHIRFLWLDWQVHRAAHQWASAGIGIGGPNQRDLWILYAVYRGWC